MRPELRLAAGNPLLDAALSMQAQGAHRDDLGLWFPIDGDSLAAVVTDDSGGAELFAMAEHEAIPILLAWWRVHHARWLRARDAQRMRGLIRGVEA